MVWYEVAVSKVFVLSPFQLITLFWLREKFQIEQNYTEILLDIDGNKNIDLMGKKVSILLSDTEFKGECDTNKSSYSL